MPNLLGGGGLQVFSSVSTNVFSTYACDFVKDLDVSLLRADYRISCDDSVHLFYEVSVPENKKRTC